MRQRGEKEMKTAKKSRLLPIAAAVLAVAICAVLVLIGVAKGSKISAELDAIEIIPTKQQNGYIEPQTEFSVTAEEDALPSANVFSQMISISPEVGFELLEQEDGYIIRAEQAFEENSVVRIEIALENGEKKSWTFQTASDFGAEKLFPADGSFDVSRDSEIRVTFSSADVTEEDFEKAFSVYPEVEGEFEKRGAVLCFIPEKALDAFCEYSVTVSGELKNSAVETLGKDLTFRFVTAADETAGSSKGRLVNMADVSETFLPSDKPIVKFGVFGSVDMEQMTAEVWRYNSEEDYKAALNDYLAKTQNNISDTVQPEVSTEGLEHIMSFSGEDAFGEFEGETYAVFPKKPGKGHYLVKLAVPDGEGGECRLFKFIQVCGITVFGANTDENVIFWVNDTADESSANGAEITLSCGEAVSSAKTAADGTATVNYPDANAKKGLLEITYNGESFISLYSFSNKEKTAAEKYYSCIYTERECYNPDDTLVFWGTVLPKEGETTPENVKITLENEEKTFSSKTVETAEDGSFFGELSFRGLSGEVWAKLEVDGETVCTQKVQIAEKGGNALSAKVTLDKEICFTGDTVTAQITVTDSEGRPAEGIELTVLFEEGEETAVVTDSNGRAEAELEAVWDKNIWEPKNCAVTVKSADGRVDTQRFCTVISRDMAVYGSYDEESGRVSVFANHIVLPDDTADSVFADDFAAIKGEAADKTVYGYLYREWSTASVDNDASYYDFLQGKKVKVYKYRHYEQIVKTYKFQTGENGDYIDELPEFKENSSYYMLLTTKDSKGRASSCKVYLKVDSGYANYYGRKNYSYVCDETDGTTMQLRLFKNGDAVEEGLLLTVTEDGEYFVGGTSTAAATDKTVYGAYFDGSRTYEVASFENERTDEENITVKITQNGDELEITAEHSDKTPVKNGAGVVFVSEDGAFTAEGSALKSENSRADIYNSCIQYTLVPKEKAEEDTATLPKAAQKTAGSYRFTTDENGKATVTAQVPAGEWEAAAVVVSVEEGEAYTGIGQKKLRVSEEFSMEYILQQEIGLEDEFSVMLHTGGEALENRDHTVQYSCSVKSAYRYSLEHPGTDVTFKTSGSEDEYVTFNFGKLTEGEYIVTVTAECGSYSDFAELKLTVSDGSDKKTAVKKLSTEELKEFRSESYPVILCTAAEEDKLIGELAGSLVAGGEESFSGYAAKLWQQSRFCNDEEAEAEWNALFDANGFSDTNESDVLLTAKFAFLQGEKPNENMREYFCGAIENARSQKDVAAGYFGLAVCGEPVLDDVKTLLKDDSFQTEEKLILTAALAVLGDDDGAKASFDKLAGRYLVHKNDGNGSNICYVYQNGMTGEEVKRITSAASLTAMVLCDEYANGFAGYFASETAEDELIADKLLCLAKLKSSAEKTQIKYTVGDVAKTAELGGGKILLLSLEYDELKNLDLQIAQGAADITVVYTERAE